VPAILEKAQPAIFLTAADAARQKSFPGLNSWPRESFDLLENAINVIFEQAFGWLKLPLVAIFLHEYLAKAAWCLIRHLL